MAELTAKKPPLQLGESVHFTDQTYPCYFPSDLSEMESMNVFYMRIVQ